MDARTRRPGAGAYAPALVVTDGEREEKATTEVFSNQLVFADNVVFPNCMYRDCYRRCKCGAEGRWTQCAPGCVC